MLLKKYLRDLPEPPFPQSLYPHIRRCPTPSNDPADVAASTYIRDTLLPQLMPCVYILLNNIFRKLHTCDTSEDAPNTDIDLMHEVSLRSHVNRMDAHNLAIVICPNLVKSSDPMQDVLVCSIPSMSTTPSTPATPMGTEPTPSTTSFGGTTLGSIVKLCIQRYYEIFDEVPDRSEADALFNQRSPSPLSSEASSSSLPNQAKRLSLRSDDEDIDDAVLVMPIGPSGSCAAIAEPESSVRLSSGASVDINTLPYKPRQRKLRRRVGSIGTGVRSINDDSHNGTRRDRRKPCSTISIERELGSGKGSVSIGRGTRKASGSGVEAMGITADGFFTPPGATSPVPSPPSSPRKRRPWV